MNHHKTNSRNSLSLSRSTKNELPFLFTSKFDFSSPDFEVESIINDQTTDLASIEKHIKDCGTAQIILNEQIVHILENDSTLFVNLSQCISMFEREFTEFPQKIIELKKLVHNASNFPDPLFDEIAPQPLPQNNEILGKAPMLVNAPLIYDSYMQQHRIDDAIQVVVNCLNH